MTRPSWGVSARLAGGRGSESEAVADGVSAPGLVLVFIRRDLAEGRLFRVAFVLDLGYGLVNLLIFWFISRVLHHPNQVVLDGAATFFDFVAVGLAFMLVVQATCTQAISRVQEHQRTGTLEATTALPVSAHVVAVGWGAYPMLLGMVRSAVYLGMAVVLLGLTVEHADWLGVTIVLVLGAVAALGLGIALTALVVGYAHGAAAGRLVVVGLGFMSGTYFPVASLPVPWRWISAALPTRMAIDGLRTALTGGAWGAIALLLAAATAVCLPCSTWLFTRALRRSRRKGTLARG